MNGTLESCGPPFAPTGPRAPVQLDRLELQLPQEPQPREPNRQATGSREQMAGVDALVVIDFETTGGETPEIVQFPWMVFNAADGELIEEKVFLVKPDGELSPERAELIGITPEELATAMPLADVIKEVRPPLLLARMPRVLCLGEPGQSAAAARLAMPPPLSCPVLCLGRPGSPTVPRHHQRAPPPGFSCG